MLECIPNVSEGRRDDVIEAVSDAVRATGAALLDVSRDVSHNRSVFTFAGPPAVVERAALAVFAAALPRIDLRTHAGVHPRLGAVDVVPFVPLRGATMGQCVAAARAVAAAVGSAYGLPVYLYGAAATAPHRGALEDVRRGQFEGLATKLQEPGWTPDFGPAVPHVTAGASIIGARPPLIAFNVNLATDRVEVARAIARTVRARGGGLRSVKALGLWLAARGVAQVSMNLTNFTETSVRQAYDAVAAEAARHGVGILDSEIVGLVPAEALSDADAAAVRLAGFSPNQRLEARLATAFPGHAV